MGIQIGVYMLQDKDKIYSYIENIIFKKKVYGDQGGRSYAGHWGPPPKSLDSDENFKPEHTLFCREVRFVAIYALFVDLWANKVLFLGQKQCTITWYILYISLS